MSSLLSEWRHSGNNGEHWLCISTTFKWQQQLGMLVQSELFGSAPFTPRQ